MLWFSLCFARLQGVELKMSFYQQASGELIKCMHGVGVKGAPRRHHVHLCSFLNTWKCLMRIYPISFDGIDWYMLIRCLHSIFFSGFLRGKNIERNILMIILVRSQIQPKFPRHGQNLFNSLTVEPNIQAQIYTLSKTGLYMIFRLFVLERCLFVWKKKEQNIFMIRVKPKGAHIS